MRARDFNRSGEVGARHIGCSAGPQVMQDQGSMLRQEQAGTPRMRWTLLAVMAGALLLGSVRPAAAHVSVATLSSAGDTFVGAKGSSKANAKKLRVGAGFTGFVAFDLSIIPSDAILHDARLRLYVAKMKPTAGPVSVEVRQVIDGWTEPGIVPAS